MLEVGLLKKAEFKDGSFDAIVINKIDGDYVYGKILEKGFPTIKIHVNMISDFSSERFIEGCKEYLIKNGFSLKM